jgi:hypothetical protein
MMGRRVDFVVKDEHEGRERSFPFATLRASAHALRMTEGNSSD